MLVATDLDGTLLGADGTLSERTRAVLAAVDRAGVPVVFVTGRPLRWMADLWDVVGSHGLAVVSNGAIVYDVAAREVLELRAIEPDDGLALVGRLTTAVPGASFAVECLSGIVRDPRFADSHRVPENSPVGPLADVWAEPAVKVLVRHDGEDHAAFRDAVLTAVGDRAVVTWSGPELVEISAPGVTKAAALARVCARLGIAAQDVVAFGDMPNDVAMLTWAGTSYAVANADPSALAAADHVALSHDDDGVARVLVELVPSARDLL